MRPLLNTLFITTDGAYLRKDGESIVVKVNGESRFRMPVHNLSGIVCMSRCVCTPELLGLCAEHGIGVSFLTPNGRFLARMQGPVSGNVLLRTAQYRQSEDLDCAAEVARSIVLGKLLNCKSSLQRTVRDHYGNGSPEPLERSIRLLGISIKDLEDESNLDKIRGIEGYGARLYFEGFRHMILGQKNDFNFSGRNRRPPLDRVNAMLSFIYTLLLHDIISALESVGLDPAVGFLHRLRPGRPSLALDMMEEFRPVIADRITLTLINLKQINKHDFEKTASGGIYLNDEGRRKVISVYQKKKQDTVQHTFLGEKFQIGMFFFAQALLMARFLRGDLDGYPPAVWK